MDHSFAEIISVFLLSMVKLVWGAVPVAIGFGFSVFETIFITCIGSFSGTLLYVSLSDLIVRRLKKRREQKIREGTLKKTQQIFTRKNKAIVRVKKRFGLTGIAFLTPVLFSMPLGCFLAVRYFKGKQKIIAYVFGSVVFWSASTAFLSETIANVIRTYFL